MRLADRVPAALKGPGQIAAGLAVSGAGTLLMIMFAARGLPQDQFSVFTTWWITVTLLVMVFGAFEVYLARAWMSATAAGRPTRPVVAQLAGQSGLLMLLLVGVLAVIAGPLADSVFGGRIWVAWGVALFGVVGSVQAVLRAVATGQQRFGIVGVQLALDGSGRAALVGTCALLAPGSVEAMIAAVLVAGVLSVALPGPRLAGWVVVPHPFSTAIPIAPIGWLLAGSLGPVLVNNLIVPWYAAADRGQPALVAGFGAAMTLARLPTQFVSAAFGPMMAELSASIDRGDEARHSRVLRRALGAAALLGSAFVAGFVIAGPLVLSIYVGAEYSVPRAVLGLLAASSAGMFLATVQQASLAARERWGTVAMAWIAAAAVFLLVLVLPLPALARAAIAPALAVAVACSALYLGLVRAKAKAQLVGDPRPA